MQGCTSEEEYSFLKSRLNEHVKYLTVPRGGNRGDFASFPFFSTSNTIAHMAYKEACTVSKPSAGFTSLASHKT